MYAFLKWKKRLCNDEPIRRRQVHNRSQLKLVFTTVRCRVFFILKNTSVLHTQSTTPNRRRLSRSFTVCAVDGWRHQTYESPVSCHSFIFGRGQLYIRRNFQHPQCTLVVYTNSPWKCKRETSTKVQRKLVGRNSRWLSFCVVLFSGMPEGSKVPCFPATRPSGTAAECYGQTAARHVVYTSCAPSTFFTQGVKPPRCHMPKEMVWIRQPRCLTSTFARFQSLGLDFSRWGHQKSVVYETLVNTPFFHLKWSSCY